MKNYVLKNGTEISVSEMIDIINYYEFECTKEYLVENYLEELSEKEIVTENEINNIVNKIRKYIDDYGYSEEDAIYEVLSDL